MARRATPRSCGEGERLRYLGIGLVYVWRYTFGLLVPSGTCKYHPSCSQYALDAFRERGLIVGVGLTVWRLLRCNPWSHGGVDPVPPKPDGRGERHA